MDPQSDQHPADEPATSAGTACDTGPLSETSPLAASPMPGGDTTLGVGDADDPRAPAVGPGREVGPVRLIREIGRGGMGTVYRGHDRLLGRDVAVKFLRDAVAPDASAVARFLDEMRAAAAVRHPNLVPVYHADVDAAVPYLVMEFVDGPTLRRLVDRTGALPVELALIVLADVATAVAALHERGLLHRDLKPANVLIDDDGTARVTDFGLAARLPGVAEGARWTSGLGGAATVGGAAGEAAGTPLYMAPELFEGRASPRSDVYALGMTAFEVLTGRRPFAFDRAAPVEEVRAAHQSRPLPVEWLAEAGVPPALVEVVERAGHKQAMFRYKSAQEFLRALKSAGGGDQPPAELARLRARLGRVVLRCQIGEGAGTAAPAAEQPPTPGSTSPVATPASTPTVTPSGSPVVASYAETLARIAAAKREVRAKPTVPQPPPLPAPPPDAVRAIRLPQPPVAPPAPPQPQPAAEVMPAPPPVAPPPRRRSWFRWPWSS